MQGIEVRDTDRGGRVTYHGPGQLVAYPIVSLKPYGDDVHEHVRRLERVAIAALAEHGVEAQTIEGLTGVWTEGAAPGSAAGGAGGAQDRLDRRPRQPRRHHPRPGDQRQQRPAAVRVDRALRDRGLPGDLSGARAGRRAGPRRLCRHASSASFGEVYERIPTATDPAALGLDSARLGVA